MKNKYENMEILDLDDGYDLLNEVLESLMKYEDEKIVSVIGRADIISFVFTTFLSEDYEYEVGKINFDPNDDDFDYCLSIDTDYNVSIHPVELSDNLKDITKVFICMDKTDQNVIDYFLDNNKDVTLFGFDADIEEPMCNGNCNNCKEYSGETDDGSTFHVKVVGDLDLDEAMAKLDEMETRMSRMSEMFDEITNFKKLFNW